MAITPSDQFSFPYPTLQAVPRPAGQGCKVCVHQTYCMAMYWFRRGLQSRAFRQQPINDDHIGIQCASWSDDPADIVKTTTTKDMEENDYIYVQGIGSEANRGGITSAVTGTYRRP